MLVYPSATAVIGLVTYTPVLSPLMQDRRTDSCLARLDLTAISLDAMDTYDDALSVEKFDSRLLPGYIYLLIQHFNIYTLSSCRTVINQEPLLGTYK